MKLGQSECRYARMCESVHVSVCRSVCLCIMHVSTGMCAFALCVFVDLCACTYVCVCVPMFRDWELG